MQAFLSIYARFEINYPLLLFNAFIKINRSVNKLVIKYVY